jgi:superoxide dismutase, Fe-Mn family
MAETRREFMFLAGGAALAAMGLKGSVEAAASYSSLRLPPLPYKPNELEPYLSARTVDLHYNQHHQGYLSTLNDLTNGTELYNRPLEEIVRKTEGQEDKVAIYNNAVLAWNHGFYWNSMKRGGGGKPGGLVNEAISSVYGGITAFQDEFVKQGLAAGVHGWLWLIRKNGKVGIIRTNYIYSSDMAGVIPLANIDLWEHAFYLDYQNRFKDYLRAWIEHLVNWDFVSANFKAG